MRNLNNLIDDDSLDVNSTYPNVLIRNGIIILVVFFTLLFITLSIIRYPEKVTREVNIPIWDKALIFPVQLNNPSIDSILLKDNQQVRVGDELVRFRDKTESALSYLSAPFTGDFLYTRNEQGSYTFFVIQRNSAKEGIKIELLSSDSVYVSGVTRLSISIENDVNIEANVKSFKFDRKNDKINVYLDISEEDYQKILKQPVLIYKPVVEGRVMLVYNKESVLNKIIGVLYKKVFK